MSTESSEEFPPFPQPFHKKDPRSAKERKREAALAANPLTARYHRPKPTRAELHASMQHVVVFPPKQGS